MYHRIGGGKNQRLGLWDGFLFKENHLKCLGGISELKNKLEIERDEAKKFAAEAEKEAEKEEREAVLLVHLSSPQAQQQESNERVSYLFFNLCASSTIKYYHFTWACCVPTFCNAVMYIRDTYMIGFNI